MSGKHSASSSPGSSQPKKARKSISLEQKLEILKKIDEGLRLKDVAKLFNLAPSTVVTIRKDKDKIKSSAKNATPLTAKLATRHRPHVMEEMERLLSLWVDDMRDREDSPMTDLVMQEKALSLYQDLVSKDSENPGPSGASVHPPFSASKGWLDRFKNRTNYHSIVQSGEAASADKEAAQSYLPVLKDIIEEGGYTPQQVFNVDETGLYWKRMPKRTVISKEEKKAPGHKASKDRVSLLVGGNAEGDLKLKPVFIHTSKNPRALKGHAKECLPVIYRSSKKAWINRYIFQDWFTSYFCPAVERYCNQKNISHKALLLLDNAPGHPTNLSDLSQHIRVEFLPKNTTALIQPMDQGVISTFKAYYLRQTFKKMICAVDSDENLSIRQFWKDFNIKHAIDNVAESWDEIKASEMNAVWRKLWPECVHRFQGFPKTQPVVRDIVGLAHEAGMDEVGEEDIDELLASHSEELSNEDLMAINQVRAEEEAQEEDEETEPQLQLTRSILSDVFTKVDSVIHAIVNNDPNRERSLKFENAIKNAFTPYNMLYKEKVSQAKQTKLTSFFTPAAARPPPPTEAAVPSTSSAARPPRPTDAAVPSTSTATSASAEKEAPPTLYTYASSSSDDEDLPALQ